MSKNRSRIISYARYRATDLLMFAAILAAFELIMFFAYTKWFALGSSFYDSGRYLFSIMIPITLAVMIRWNWYGLFYAVGDGVLWCILTVTGSEGLGSYEIIQLFATYCIGNAFIGLSFLMVRFMGYKRITSKWYWTFLYALCGWVSVYLGRSLLVLCFGGGASSFRVFLSQSEILSLAMAILILLVLRRLEGMLERQKDYLLRLERERKEKMMADTFGEKFVEIDSETLKTLNKKGDDLFGK